MKKGVWVQSAIEVKGETLYFFHPVGGGGAIACVALRDNGRIEFSGHRDISIKGIGTSDESLTVKSAAEVVV